MLRGTFLGADRRGGRRDEGLVIGILDVAHHVVQRLGQPMAALQAPCCLPVLVIGSGPPVPPGPAGPTPVTQCGHGAALAGPRDKLQPIPVGIVPVNTLHTEEDGIITRRQVKFGIRKKRRTNFTKNSPFDA